MGGDCKSVGNGDKALVYLGRYLYRGGIREADILACDPNANGLVSFRYRDRRSGKLQVRTLPGTDFLHLLLQHVLPKGFRRARHYGFLHPNKKGLIALLHRMLRINPPAPPPEKPRPAVLCPCCGKPMQVIRQRIAPTGSRRRETAAASETAVSASPARRRALRRHARARPKKGKNPGKSRGPARKSPDFSDRDAKSGAAR